MQSSGSLKNPLTVSVGERGKENAMGVGDIEWWRERGREPRKEEKLQSEKERGRETHRAGGERES